MSNPSPSPEARRYARIRYRLALIELACSLALLLVYQASGLSAWTADLAYRASEWLAAQVAVYAVIFGAISYLVFLPMHFYSGFVLEHRFRLSRQSLGAWITREAKRLALSAVFGLLLTVALYLLLRHAPGTWVLWATAGWVLVSVVLARVLPTWLVPMFYKVTPLREDQLAGRLLALCERAKLPVLGVFRVDLGTETRKANAALTGLGRTRRVMVSDTLLERFTADEIETVLAHELGHQHHRHILKFLMLSAAGSWLAFWLVEMTSGWWVDGLGLSGLDDLLGFPVVMLIFSLLGLIGMPLQNAISRHFEWQSDHYAVELSKAPLAFASALTKLADLNLADPSPPKWIEWLFYDHPPITERIRAAESSG